MNLAIVGMGTARDANIEALKSTPEFRKATLNMTLAAASQNEALATLEGCLSPEMLASSMMILGSSYGELGVTIGFLEHWSQSGVARPLLFQNSLHNSTLGFLVMRLNLQGPAFTVSNGVHTGKNCLELASTLLHDRKIPLCIVTCVDSIVTQPYLDKAMSVGSQGQGAGTLLLTRIETANKNAWNILGLDSSLGQPPHAHADDSFLNNSYHSDAIERLIEHLRSTL